MWLFPEKGMDGESKHGPPPSPPPTAKKAQAQSLGFGGRQKTAVAPAGFPWNVLKLGGGEKGGLTCKNKESIETHAEKQKVRDT